MEEPSTQPTKQPVDASPTPVVPTVEQKSSSNQSPIQLVLQWLTYAFWGWFLLACAWNLAVIIGMLVANKTEVSGVIPYSLASLFVLLPIAAVTDFIYQRQEPRQKVGGASAIMAIHAVLFALLTIGVFVFAIFSIIRLTTAVGNDDGITTALLTSLIMTVLYAITFLRVVNPFKTKRIGRVYAITMIVVGVAIGVAAVVGPLASSLRSRDDRAILSALSPISASVNRYVREEKKLPMSLKQLDLDPVTKVVVDKNLVTIEKRTISLPDAAKNFINDSQTSLGYQLCATYTTSKEGSLFDNYSYRDIATDEDDLYNISAHKEGRVCYKQTATYEPIITDRVKEPDTVEQSDGINPNGSDD